MDWKKAKKHRQQMAAARIRAAEYARSGLGPIAVMEAVALVGGASYHQAAERRRRGADAEAASKAGAIAPEKKLRPLSDPS